MSQDTLAIDGGDPAVPQLPPSAPKLGKEELLALIALWELSPETADQVRAAIEADAHVAGPHLFRYYNPKPSRVAAAEAAMAKAMGTDYALAVNSCTSALLASYRALGVGAGDEVIVPAYTFFATAATVAAANAVPVIADIDESLNLDAESVEKAITPRTKAIAVVHMRGGPAQMDALMDVANRKGLPVVEDVAQSCGGSFQGERLGSIGTMGCFSFDYYKVIVSGEGGFITTDDEWLHTRATSWHDTAACWRPDRYAGERKPGELFCGENYRMSELQGAVAVEQIAKLDGIVSGYRRVADLIREGLADCPGITLRRMPDPEGDIGASAIFFVDDGALTKKVTDALRAEGVPAGGRYDTTVRDWHIYTYWEHIMEKKPVAADGLPWSAIPEAEQPVYTMDMCPRAIDLLERSIHIRTDPAYTDDDCAAIVRAVRKVMGALTA